MPKPKFADLWKNFPDHQQYKTMFDLYMMLGGAAQKNIHAPGFGANGNACASRMSVALSLAGHRIDAGIAQTARARTLGTDKGYRIIYGVADLRSYLLIAFGQPQTDNVSPYNDAFVGKKGIVAFNVRGWTGAVGHIALWNGSAFREPTSDDYSQYSDGPAATVKGEFWEMP
ncbi:T6SS effector amidase Tae4 family protein [Agrobacterium rosae]|uniref:T6SS effector amidase Tae4 family protein n=1 Tax=Agrobacterium rosae TaxID=1972867 RepID=UPI002A150FBF|nr:T6SS effector amidase Tae4 family protein [Agrobacterium rosae]MDX8315743.1 T6SS effector amidase Tae4 family protein [Agrobacterium rosae]